MSAVSLTRGIPPVNKFFALSSGHGTIPNVMRSGPGTTWSLQLGQMIRQARERRGWTQWDLAQRLGYSASDGSKATPSGWEVGKRVPPEKKITLLCTVLDLDAGVVASLVSRHHLACKGVDTEATELLVKETSAHYGQGAGMTGLDEDLVRALLALRARDPNRYDLLRQMVLGMVPMSKEPANEA